MDSKGNKFTNTIQALLVEIMYAISWNMLVKQIHQVWKVKTHNFTITRPRTAFLFPHFLHHLKKDDRKEATPLQRVVVCTTYIMLASLVQNSGSRWGIVESSQDLFSFRQWTQKGWYQRQPKMVRCNSKLKVNSRANLVHNKE